MSPFLRAAVAALILLPAASADGPRSVKSLDGPWEFRRDGQAAWKPVTVPSAMQSHEGTDWHGIGWYRKAVGKVEVPAGKRLVVHFTAAATFAEVFWNGTKVGEHLGGWTPFRCDVTDLVRKAGPDAIHELTVKLDERVGHNTQGFLPIVQPHYGGLWQSVQLLTLPEKPVDDLRVELPKGIELPVWSPKEPKLKKVVVTSESGDRVSVRTAKRTMEVKGNQLLLNGEPLQVRGVLNWGYYPPTLEPNPSPDVWRADLKRIKARGFNLMKCCLWVPPARLLDIADEEGVLIWMEYPTWHPQLTPKHLPDLMREFEEFFAHVRHHPSVILHSLTCETGPSADINVLKALTAKCKAMIPGAVVEDDSSWIEWNRVTDFYDDHPYGNNHTWVKALHRLRDYKALGVKPLLLGEAIAADTWTDVGSIGATLDSALPYWLPYHYHANKKWLDQLAASGAKIDEKQLIEDSKKYAMLMRKYQMETFRREVPTGGYVVSVIRDFPLAAMGLVDYLGKDKWPAEAWNWHGETMLTLETKNDRKSFAEGDEFAFTIKPAGPIPAGAETRISMIQGDLVLELPEGGGGTPDIKNVLTPNPIRLAATVTVGGRPVTANSWPAWFLPKPQPTPADVIVARRLDEALLTKLEAGAKVLLLPDNQLGSPPLQSHWFLRGGPAVFDQHAALKNVPRDLLVETQHFDLAGDVIPNVSYLAEIDPILLLWDNHDIREVRTHALAFTTRVGKGRLLVSALKHDGETNAVGKWLLGEFGKSLADGPDPRNALTPATITGIRQKLTEQKVELGRKVWKFQPDPKNDGLKQNWHEPATKIAGWADIKIDKHWEGQGYPTLDGWAWYRLTVDVPKEFAGKDVYLRFTGVDDYYEVFVNGKKAGSGGDIEKKLTAFEEVKAHAVTHLVKPGEPATIAVRVYDWYGAGGLFRPVTLTTAAGAGGGSAFVK